MAHPGWLGAASPVPSARGWPSTERGAQKRFCADMEGTFPGWGLVAPPPPM